MNESLFRKKITYLLCSLCISAFLFCGYAPEAKAEELVTVEGDTSGILQGGGLLEEDPNDGIMTLALDADYTGAEKAISNALKNFQTAVDLKAYCLPRSEFVSFYRRFLNSHPEFFYLNLVYSYSYSGDTVVSLFVSYTEDTATLKKMVAQYNSKISEITAPINSSWSDLEKAMYINDYLALNCEYDYTYKKYNAYNVLVEGTAVCQGYALAYLGLMNDLGIPCEIVSSSSLNHAWDLIRVGSSWYHVDVTWNDPSSIKYGRARHLYLLKSTSWFLSDEGGHGASDYLYSGAAGADQACDTAFDDYFWNSIDTPFNYYSGCWYANQNGSINKYSGSNSGLQQIQTLKTLSSKWFVWGSTSVYYRSDYSGCQIYNGKLYYATPTSIQSLNLSALNADASVVCALTDAQQAEGYIYGFYIASDGYLRYEIGQAPGEVSSSDRIHLHAHSYGSWATVSAATCTSYGQKARSCSVCGFKQVDIIPAAGHKAGAAATCTTPQTCTVCKAVLVKATGHKAGAAATCTTAQKCTVCKTVLVKAKGHKAGAAATCTTAQKCTVCKTVLKKATGHQHTKTVTQKATFVKKGSVKTVCKDCGKTVKTRTIAKVKCQKGKVYKVGNYKYKIVSAKTNGKGTVAFAGLANNVKRVNVVDTVTILGAKFKVVQIADKALKNKSAVTSVTIGKNVQTIGKEAFCGTKKLKTITIKSTRLTRVGANALKNIYAKARIRVPKAKLKKYKTLLNNRGQKKTVKIY